MLRIETPELLKDDALSGVPVTNEDVRIVLEMEGIVPRVGEDVFYAADSCVRKDHERVMGQLRDRVTDVLDRMGFSVFAQPQNVSSSVGIWKPLTDPSFVFKHTKGLIPRRFDVPDHPNLVAERIFPLYDLKGKHLVEALTVAPDRSGVLTLDEMRNTLSLQNRLKVLMDALRGSNAELFPRGLHHSDVKPRNIFVVEGAKDVSGELFDFEGVGVGTVKTPLYSAESYFGKHSPRLTVGHDVFSYGVSMLEILSSEDGIISFYKSWQRRREVIDKFAPQGLDSVKLLKLYYKGLSHLVHDYCERSSIPAPVEVVILEMLDPRAGDMLNVSSMISRIEAFYKLPKLRLR